MIGLLVSIDLAATFGTRERLRAYIAEESLPRYRDVNGLRLKVYVSDETANTFGGFYLWESEDALAAALPRIAASLRSRYGVTPTIQRFEVEAIVEGRHATPDFASVGRFFEPPSS